MTATEKLAESTTVQVLSRIAMLVTPFLLSAILGIGWLWLDDKFADLETLKSEMPVVKERVKVLETTIERGRQDREEFQRDTTQTLNRIVEVQTQMMRELSAITAIVDERERQRQLQERRGR